MAATIKIKNSSTASAVPTSSDLVQGELAVNVTDKRLFTENASGTVVELGTNPTILTMGAAGSASAPVITRTGDTNTGIFFPAADTIAFAEGGVEAMRLDSAGNLGLGVTPSAWSNITALQVKSGSLSAGSVDTYLSSNAFYSTNSPSGWKYITSTTATQFYQNASGGEFVWRTAASGTAGNAITFTTAMTLDASGNLGVGTTSPQSYSNYKILHVAGPATNGSGLLYFTNSNNSLVGIANADGANSLITFGSQTNHPIRFATNDTERARIDSSGNFLVGVTAAFGSSGSGVQIYNNSGQAGRLNIGKNTSGLFNAIANYYSGTYVGGVNYDNTTTSFPTSSDVRLKKDIVAAGSASAKIDQIRIVSHGWKHDDAVVEFGVIAQELVNVAPQAVSVGDDGEEVETTWGVDYSKLVPMLIKAHQEQQAIITQLQADVATLKGKA